jgi:hypothetical protein
MNPLLPLQNIWFIVFMQEIVVNRTSQHRTKNFNVSIMHLENEFFQANYNLTYFAIIF